MRTVEEVFAALFAVQPLHSSFKTPVMPKAVAPGMHHAVMSAIGAVNGDPCLAAAAYLYADDLSAAHNKVYDMAKDEEAAYWHGMMHRREGDFYNANYWFRQTGILHAKVGVDPVDLTARVEAFHRSASAYPSQSLLEDLRKEFRNLAQVGIDRIFPE